MVRRHPPAAGDKVAVFSAGTATQLVAIPPFSARGALPMVSSSQLPALREMLRRAGIEVAHYSPGRLRLRVRRVKADAPFAAELQHRLGAMPGIRQLRLRPLTGSVLLEFSADVLTGAAARKGLLDTLADLFPEIDKALLAQLLAERRP